MSDSILQKACFSVLENYLWDRIIRRYGNEGRTKARVILQRACFLELENLLQDRMIRRVVFGASE